MRIDYCGDSTIVYYDKRPPIRWLNWFPKEKPKMSKPTQEQLERVFEAAQAVVRGTAFNAGDTTVNVIPDLQFQDMCAAVRAAQQPRWTVRDEPHVVPTLVNPDGGPVATGVSSCDRPLFRRIMRLLNEDDAKGGK